MSLETKIGPLYKVLPLFNPDTIQHAAEIMNDRRTLEDESKRDELRGQWLWTADSELYRVEDDEAVLYDGNIDTNLIFRNIKDAKKQLRENNNYVPNSDDIQSVLDSENTLRIVLRDLGLRGDYNGWRYIDIDTSDYNGENLNNPQRALAQRKYGSMEKKIENGREYTDFGENMKMLNKAGIKTIKIYVLSPDYVKRNVNGDGAIARLSRLGSFGDSSFIADGNNIDDRYHALRGVLFSKP